jgi:hypothetical protein
MVKKLEKGRTTPKIASQHQSKQIHHKKEYKSSMDEKIKYARIAYLNEKRTHIKRGIGYKTSEAEAVNIACYTTNRFYLHKLS